MALRNRVDRLERHMKPPDGRCGRCGRPHFSFADLLQQALGENSPQDAPAFCECVWCCKAEQDTVTKMLADVTA